MKFIVLILNIIENIFYFIKKYHYFFKKVSPTSLPQLASFSKQEKL